MVKPFLRSVRKKDGFLCLWLLFAFALQVCLIRIPVAIAGDGATEALELRYHAEKAIAQEQATGNAELALAMREALPGLLQEYLVTRDGSIALDTVDAAFVQEQMRVGRVMEEPGIALALEVFSGPGTGFEHGMQTAIANLASFNERNINKVSEAALDAHERVMERHLDKVERHLEKANEIAEAAESTFQTRLDTKLDAVAERLADKAEKAANKAEQKAEKAAEKAEKVAEKAEEKAEKAAEKAEKVAEKAEEKAEKAAEKAEQKKEESDGTKETEGGKERF